jgi:hypothetical protein
MIETLARVLDLNQRSAVLTDLEATVSDSNYTDRLSDQLLEHMIDCTACLNDCVDGADSSCAIYCSLQAEIKAHGGPTRGISFGY